MYNFNIIKSKIILKDKSIKNVAEELNLNEQTISNWINDRNTDNIKKFITLLDYLDIEIEELKKATPKG